MEVFELHSRSGTDGFASGLFVRRWEDLGLEEGKSLHGFTSGGAVHSDAR